MSAVLNSSRIFSAPTSRNGPRQAVGTVPAAREPKGAPKGSLLKKCAAYTVPRQSRSLTRARATSGGNGVGSVEHVENVVIIGSGPAGFTAAIYCARASLRPLVFEGYQMGGPPGGQLMSTTEVENFPGFPEGITGPELMDRMRAQATRWGSRTVVEDVLEVDLSQRPFVIKGMETTVRAHSVIIATGATAKRLGIPSEERFWSQGISACAICDGASPIFKGQELAVVGGGDTATEEAVYLTKYGKHVHLLVRGAAMRASKAMQERVLNNPKITVHFNSVVEDAYAGVKGRMEGLKVKDTASGEARELPVRGLFYGIGHVPNSSFLKGQIKTDEEGYVKIGPGGLTNIPGVFAAGDLHDVQWRQAITAAGAGCAAALAAERYLVGEGLAQEYPLEHEEAEEKVEEAPKTTAKKSAAAEAEAVCDVNETRHKGQLALRKLYHESDRLLAVLYTSPTCGPCRALKPMFNKVVDEYEGRVHFVEIDIVEDQEIAEAGGVTGTPTVQLFYKKALVHHLPGVKMKSEYRALFEEVLSGAREEVAV